MTTLTAAPANSRFHYGHDRSKIVKAKREKGERREDRGDGTVAVFIDGRFVAITAA